MEASNAYVIVGNAALVRCEIPSFVSDLVEVVSWEDEEGNVHTENSGYGTWTCGYRALLLSFAAVHYINELFCSFQGRVLNMLSIDTIFWIQIV